MNEAIDSNVVHDERTAIALSEEIPVTNFSLGQNFDQNLTHLRSKLEIIVTRTNDFSLSENILKIKCDCCLSYKSSKEENN